MKALHINAVLMMLSAALIFESCTTKPTPIVYGKDVCDECKMNIVDIKFANEILTKKGKVYKFDDLHCLTAYLKDQKIKETEIARTVAINFENNDQFIDVQKAWFVVSLQLKSPMNSNTVAFEKKATADKKAKEVNGEVMNWISLYKSLQP